MNAPRATYRLQFRNGMDFDRAAGLAGYLSRLGVSHLYCSPLFEAVPGSSHGYDVTDHGRFDDELGGIEGFLRLSAALKDHGLGLILDIVPNHMAASPHNPWWHDVLRHGRDSRYAGHFDIDWSAPKLLLPILGRKYAGALEAGEFSLGFEPRGLTLAYFDNALPLDPRSWRIVKNRSGMDFPGSGSGDATTAFLQWISDPANAEGLAGQLRELSQDRELIDLVHSAQPWRLVYWRAARDRLTYRRFFEIADLVGVRVEDEDVFRDVHRFLFELLAADHVDGVRVDHVDGLADPGAYLRRLRETAPGDPPIWVEKILAPDEVLRAGWPVEGTTGYEFASMVCNFLTDHRGAQSVADQYGRYTDVANDPEHLLDRAKFEILTVNLASELEQLVRLATSAAELDPWVRDWGPDTLRRAIIAVARSMPVYRTYLEDSEIAPDDETVLAAIEQQASRRAGLDDAAIIGDFLRLIRNGEGHGARRLRVRFEQTTGALMAKALEDTFFYRYTPLLSANEVGGEGRPCGTSAAEFCRQLVQRGAHQKAGLNATATHDTKRGEDARMRIAAIADRPQEWHAAVRAWDDVLRETGARLPDRQTVWIFYQSLLGAWDTAGMSDLSRRMAEYLIKVAREAKLATSWTRPDEAYESSLTEFVERTLSDREFQAAFSRHAGPFIALGERKSLVQLALKLTLPGIPDIYQGTEWADLSLVDPDNRRPVNFAARDSALSGPASEDGSLDERKMRLMATVLAMRSSRPELFSDGDLISIEPLEDSGRHFGFTRSLGDDVLLVVGELAPAGRGSVAPAGFALPAGWENVGLNCVCPSSQLDIVNGCATVRGGSWRDPVIVALGQRCTDIRC